MRLTAAQWSMLGELIDPNNNPDNTWYFPNGKDRTLRILARHGLAVCTESGFLQRVGYCITALGRKTYQEHLNP